MSRTLAALVAVVVVSACDTSTDAAPDLNPRPRIDRVEPSTVPVGSGGVSLSLVGAGFVEGAVARWNGGDRQTVVQDSSSITLTARPEDLLVAGTHRIEVVNPEPGGGPSISAEVRVLFPVPRLDSIRPTSTAAVLADGTTLSLFGSGFTAHDTGSRVILEGIALPTTVTSSSQLRAEVPDYLLRRGAQLDVSVRNPGPGGGESQRLFLTAHNPVPALVSMEPDSLTVNRENTLTLRGSGFVDGIVVSYRGVSLQVLAVSESALTVRVPVALAVRPGGDLVVANPPPSGGSSSALAVGVRELPPRAMRIVSPRSFVEGASVELLLEGIDFAPDAAISVNGVLRPATMETPFRLRATLPAEDADSVGLALIRVVNPRGGGASPPDSIEILPRGRIVYLPNGNVIRSARLDGRDTREVALPRTGGISYVETAPDGEGVLYESPAFRRVSWTDMQSSFRQLTDTSLHRPPTSLVREAYPSFSRDGAWVVFEGWEERDTVPENPLTPRLWRVRADGTDAGRILPDSVEGWHRFPTFSRDGTRISTSLYLDPDGIRDRLTIIDLATLERTILPVAAHRSRWSPDDRWIAYVRPDGNIRAIRPDGSGDHSLTTEDTVWSQGSLEWSPDGRWLILMRRFGQTRLIEFATGRWLPLMSLPLIEAVTWSPDPGGS